METCKPERAMIKPRFVLTSPALNMFRYRGSMMHWKGIRVPMVMMTYMRE